MTIEKPKHLAPEQLGSLVELALATSTSAIPPFNLATLIALGYVTMAAKGAIVTGDGRMVLTESE